MLLEYSDRTAPRKPSLLRRGRGELYEIEKILTGLRSTAVRQNPRPLGRGASHLLFICPPSLNMPRELTSISEALYENCGLRSPLIHRSYTMLVNSERNISSETK
jgi:hypothetical protein